VVSGTWQQDKMMYSPLVFKANIRFCFFTFSYCLIENRANFVFFLFGWRVSNENIVLLYDGACFWKKFPGTLVCFKSFFKIFVKFFGFIFITWNSRIFTSLRFLYISSPAECISPCFESSSTFLMFIMLHRLLPFVV